MLRGALRPNIPTIVHTLDKTVVAEMLCQGKPVKGLDGRLDLTPEVLDCTDNLVLVMGAEPFVEALKMGANVIVAA